MAIKFGYNLGLLGREEIVIDFNIKSMPDKLKNLGSKISNKLKEKPKIKG